MKNERISQIKKEDFKKGPVVYWLTREMRVHDNWSLVYAQSLAIQQKQPLIVCFCIDNTKPITQRKYEFLLPGLQEFSSNLHKKNIPLVLLFGKYEEQITAFIKETGASSLLCDFYPLKTIEIPLEKIVKSININVYQVDSHNIVPCKYVSQKQEYAAYTIRKKIHKTLPVFLNKIPTIKKHPFSSTIKNHPIAPEEIIAKLQIDSSVYKSKLFNGGESEAEKTFAEFLKNNLTRYSEKRNDPTLNAQSNLSPYLNYGFISAQKIALTLEEMPLSFDEKASFLEELIVRKELSDNFCFYNENYDNIKCAPNWAALTLQKHLFDKRPYIYTKTQLENAQTHDDLWNASQSEMIKTGKMHGFLRMYWAKKILEWTKTPDYAFKTAVFLNDKYSLDGCDPKGYTGIAWSICGVHDRAWFTREIFGKIRFMSYNGCKSKFNIKKYITYVTNL